ncbi:DNA-3-methyladenine glycosylase 2 family protein [Cellulomonas fimi]|uniref:DNA-3-methyladenine glycosylase II n=1 Tax=Cellulomonas fimi TaxID=1708 RepID=A0A7Y0QJI5_CELFI|nr:DNA-3-methyladenine glycosylase 2 family protein [Cellulomonas fimi]
MSTSVDLGLTEPFAHGPALAVLAAHAVAGCEVVDVAAGTHRRLVAGAHGPVAVTIALGATAVELTVESDEDADVRAAVGAVRTYLDLDLDPADVIAVLGVDPVVGHLVRTTPGLRVIGHPDGFEAGCTTILGQQVSLAAARTFVARLAAAYGRPGPGGLRQFPAPGDVAARTPAEIQAAVRVPAARARTLHAFATACADGLRLDAQGDHADIRRRLLALPGVGPWTVEYLAVRLLRDQDAFPAGDLVLRRALGVPDARAAAETARSWSPLRAYALFHLWTEAAYARRGPAEALDGR